MNASPRPAIPWSAWGVGASAAFCVLALMTGHYWYLDSPAHYRRASLEALAHDRAFRVVLLGSSRLRRGLDNERELEQRLEKVLHRPVRVVKIARSGGKLPDFLPLSTLLTTAAPHWVVLESTFLEDDGVPPSAWLVHWQGIRATLNHHLWPGNWLPIRPVQDSIPKRQEPAALMSEKAEQAAREETAASWRLSEGFSSFVRPLLAGGAHVSVIDIPRMAPCGAIELEKWRRLYASLPSDLRQERRLRHESPPDWRLSTREYFDIGHMNPRGRRLYESWFLQVAAEAWPKEVRL